MNMTQAIMQFIRNSESAGFIPTSIGVGDKGMQRLLREFDTLRAPSARKVEGQLTDVRVCGVRITE